MIPEQAMGKIEDVDIEEEMKKSYIDYAMSVIVGRALPDVRDGLKPVHRRILYAMYDMGNTNNRPHRKCARIVGEVLGKYHPHGDVAVYDTLVRMAQDFSMRYELIDGHGNFGSIDGDSPAAMRYTEARLSPFAMELLRNIEQNTVEFNPNFDETLKEPEVLPCRVPNLLINGSAGIAVGMTTNIPPHNIGEVIDGINALIDDPEIKDNKLFKFVKGPDFPTGGIIMGKEGIKEAYLKGRGSIILRGSAHIEQTKKNRYRIVITEVPYQVNKAKLTEKIAELVRDKRVDGISDLRDESDRSGMRLVVELKREAPPNVIMNQLFKHSQLQISYGIIMIALVDGVPRTLSLRQILQHYIDYQKEIIIRRTKHELRRAEERSHILEGLIIALDRIDDVIKTIKKAKDVDSARQALIEKFKLTEIQAQAILDMRLQKLTGLEREKIKLENKELKKRIKEFKAILADEKKVLGIVKQELLEAKNKYSDKRRTQIKSSQAELETEDLIAEEEMVITITHSGYVKRLPVNTYKKQHRGGRGVMGMNLKDNDFVEHLFICSTHDHIFFFSTKGKVYRLKVHELPTGSRQSKGQAIVNVLPFTQNEMIAAVIAIKNYKDFENLIFVTKNGLVKKTKLEAYRSVRSGGIIAIYLRDDDELIDVKLSNGSDEVIMVTKHGQSIRFSEKDARPMGRNSMGVKGISLKDGDKVLGFDIFRKDCDLLVITEKGYGKRTPLSKYTLQKRGGKGIKTLKMSKSKGNVIGAKVVNSNHEIMLISNEGIILRVPISGISSMGRNTQGVRIMNLKGKDNVSSIARVITGNKRQDKPETKEAISTDKK